MQCADQLALSPDRRYSLMQTALTPLLISVSLSLSARFSVLFVVVDACFVSSALAVGKTNLLSVHIDITH